MATADPRGTHIHRQTVNKYVTSYCAIFHSTTVFYTKGEQQKTVGIRCQGTTDKKSRGRERPAGSRHSCTVTCGLQTAP